MKIPIYSGGQSGVNQDIAPHELAPEFFTSARNVRFSDLQFSHFLGEKTVYNSPVVLPYGLHCFLLSGTFIWVYMGLAKIYAITGQTHTEITRLSGNYTGTVADKWVSGELNGVGIFNNGLNQPQAWLPISGSQRLVDLPNFASIYTRADVVRPFKNFLIALGVTESGTYHPYVLAWSEPADPGAVPVSWNYADPTKLAGKVAISSEGGPLVDCLPLGNVNVVYQENAITIMQPTGNLAVFKLEGIATTSGLLARNCAAEIKLDTGGKNVKAHFFVSGEDIALFDGSVVQSLISERLRSTIFSMIDTTHYKKSFVATNPLNKEVWYCFPETGSDICTLALVWNWQRNIFTFRELKQISAMKSGPIDEAGDMTFDATSDTGTFDSGLGAFDSGGFDQSRPRILMARSIAQKLLYGDVTNQFSGESYYAFAERIGLALVGQDRQGQPKVDIQSRKLCTEVWIRATGDPFDVTVGSQQTLTGPVTWSASKVFDPDSMTKLDFTVEGKLLAIRFSSGSNVHWAVQGYDMNIEITGKY